MASDGVRPRNPGMTLCCAVRMHNSHSQDQTPAGSRYRHCLRCPRRDCCLNECVCCKTICMLNLPLPPSPPELPDLPSPPPLLPEPLDLPPPLQASVNAQLSRVFVNQRRCSPVPMRSNAKNKGNIMLSDYCTVQLVNCTNGQCA